MKSNYSKLIMVCIAIQLSSFTYGQTAAKKNITHQRLLWFRYFNRLTLSDRWQINTQVEERTYAAPWKQHQFTARTQLIYKVSSSVSVSQGFVYFLQSPQDPESKSKFAVPELRPYQEIILRNDLSKKLKVNHRYKIEERFFRNNDPKKEKLLNGYTFNFRIRYLLQFQYSLFNIGENKPLKLIVSDELMVNLGEEIVNNAFDQNRFTLGLAYDFTRNIGVEIDYVNWFQQRTSGRDYYNRNIGRFTLYHYIDLSTKKQDLPLKTS